MARLKKRILDYQKINPEDIQVGDVMIPYRDVFEEDNPDWLLVRGGKPYLVERISFYEPHNGEKWRAVTFINEDGDYHLWEITTIGDDFEVRRYPDTLAEARLRKKLKKTEQYIIVDWMSNHLFQNEVFDGFEEGWGFIYDNVDDGGDESTYDDYFVVKLSDYNNHTHFINEARLKKPLKGKDRFPIDMYVNYSWTRDYFTIDVPPGKMSYETYWNIGDNIPAITDVSLSHYDYRTGECDFTATTIKDIEVWEKIHKDKIKVHYDKVLNEARLKKSLSYQSIDPHGVGMGDFVIPNKDIVGGIEQEVILTAGRKYKIIGVFNDHVQIYSDVGTHFSIGYRRLHSDDYTITRSLVNEARLKKPIKIFSVFEDLEFRPHPSFISDDSAVHAFMKFPNGHYISVIGGSSCYGDGKNSFEVSIDKDIPIPWVSPDKVTELMIRTQRLPNVIIEARLKKPIRKKRPSLILLHDVVNDNRLEPIRRLKTISDILYYSVRTNFNVENNIKMINSSDGGWLSLVDNETESDLYIVCTPEYYIKQYGKEEYDVVDPKYIIMNEARLKKSFKKSSADDISVLVNNYLSSRRMLDLYNILFNTEYIFDNIYPSNTYSDDVWSWDDWGELWGQIEDYLIKNFNGTDEVLYQYSSFFDTDQWRQYKQNTLSEARLKKSFKKTWDSMTIEEFTHELGKLPNQSVPLLVTMNGVFKDEPVISIFSDDNEEWRDLFIYDLSDDDEPLDGEPPTIASIIHELNQGESIHTKMVSILFGTEDNDTACASGNYHFRDNKLFIDNP